MACVCSAIIDADAVVLCVSFVLRLLPSAESIYYRFYFIVFIRCETIFVLCVRALCGFGDRASRRVDHIAMFRSTQVINAVDEMRWKTLYLLQSSQSNGICDFLVAISTFTATVWHIVENDFTSRIESSDVRYTAPRVVGSAVIV